MTNKMPNEAKAAGDYPKIGALLKERRSFHGWTLSEVSKMTGISVSALSKIENNAMSPTYATILQLCQGLQIEIADLLNPATGRANENIMGRRSVSRQHEGNIIQDKNYAYTYLCSEVAHKRIIPMFVTVSAHSLADVGGLWSHVGEEFIYVLSGTLQLLTDFYEPTELAAGDSVYIDSTMGHAYLSAGADDAQILVMCSSATPNLAQTLREILKQRLATKAELGDTPQHAEQPRTKSPRRKAKKT